MTEQATKLMGYAHKVHKCNVCNKTFDTVKRESAHALAYRHFMQDHAARISLACYETCKYRSK